MVFEAPNYIIDLCCEQLNADGSVSKLTDEEKANILKIVDGRRALNHFMKHGN